MQLDSNNFDKLMRDKGMSGRDKIIWLALLRYANGNMKRGKINLKAISDLCGENTGQIESSARNLHRSKYVFATFRGTQLMTYQCIR